jgi:hypothetical protein
METNRSSLIYINGHGFLRQPRLRRVSKVGLRCDGVGEIIPPLSRDSMNRSNAHERRAPQILEKMETSSKIANRCEKRLKFY